MEKEVGRRKMGEWVKVCACVCVSVRGVDLDLMQFEIIYIF